MILPITPVGKIISRPYEGGIPNFKEKNASIERLSKLAHEVNPDYLLFHPSINSIQNVWLLASYCGAWLGGQNIFFLLAVIYDYIFYSKTTKKKAISLSQNIAIKKRPTNRLLRAQA